MEFGRMRKSTIKDEFHRDDDTISDQFSSTIIFDILK